MYINYIQSFKFGEFVSRSNYQYSLTIETTNLKTKFSEYFHVFNANNFQTE